MIKSNLPPTDTTTETAAPARPRRVAPSVRTPIKPAQNEQNRESAARRTHRQRMKAYFTGEKPAG